VETHVAHHEGFMISEQDHGVGGSDLPRQQLGERPALRPTAVPKPHSP
jgi:hypothetical protein